MDPTSARPWIRTIDPGASLRLFCFPYAGGGTAEYRTWAPHFPGTVDVCAVVFPGRETRMSEKAYSDAPTLVQHLVRDLLPLMRRTPFAFFGHSMGAWVAFETCRELRRQNRPLPEHLFVSARRAPHLRSSLPQLSHLPRDRFIAGVQDRYQAIPPQILDEPDILDLFLPTLRADFSLLDTYRFLEEDPLDIPIAAYRGQQDRLVTRDHLRGWERHTSAEYTQRDMPGGHFFLRECPDLLTGAVAGVLRRYM